jgi:hypothetical protein
MAADGGVLLELCCRLVMLWVCLKYGLELQLPSVLIFYVEVCVVYSSFVVAVSDVVDALACSAMVRFSFET